MKRLKVFLIFVFLLFNSSLLAYSSDPKEFVQDLVTEAIEKLSDKNLTIEQKSKFVEKVALENVDINALGLYTLGELRKSSNKVDLMNYQTAFEKYFLKSLTSRLTDYSSSKFEVVESEKKSATYTIIKSVITPEDSSPKIKIDWRIYTKNSEKPLIRDLMVEGLSLARTQKEEFNSIIQGADGDVEVLFASLRNFSKK